MATDLNGQLQCLAREALIDTLEKLGLHDLTIDLHVICTLTKAVADKCERAWVPAVAERDILREERQFGAPKTFMGIPFKEACDIIIAAKSSQGGEG